MKPDTDYFEKIRMRPRGRGSRAAQQEAQRASVRTCEAPGCEKKAEHKAPKGRHAEGEYHWFCLDHVREYNKSYNYFSGMDDVAIQSYQKEAIIGHRPTWKVGANAANGEAQPLTGKAKLGWNGKTQDPFRLFGGNFQMPPPEPSRTVHNMERKSLETLGLDETASGSEVKARYKALVKRHHPDANGGDRSLEDRLRQIIQAYNYLKDAGYR